MAKKKQEEPESSGWKLAMDGFNMIRDAFVKTLHERDAVYRERAKVVAALSKCFPAHLTLHQSDEAWDDQWRTIVCLHLPTGNVTWHIHDSELELFKHLQVEENHYDGHTTEEKYERLAALPKMHLASAERDERIAKALSAVQEFLK